MTNMDSIIIEISTDNGAKLHRRIGLTDGQLAEGYYSTGLQEMVDVLLDNEEVF